MLACMNNKIKVVKKLKETKKHVIDIGDTMMKDTTLSYIDGAHYNSSWCNYNEIISKRSFKIKRKYKQNILDK